MTSSDKWTTVENKFFPISFLLKTKIYWPQQVSTGGVRDVINTSADLWSNSVKSVTAKDLQQVCDRNATCIWQSWWLSLLMSQMSHLQIVSVQSRQNFTTGSPLECELLVVYDKSCCWVFKGATKKMFHIHVVPCWCSDKSKWEKTYKALPSHKIWFNYAFKWSPVFKMHLFLYCILQTGSYKVGKKISISCFLSSELTCCQVSSVSLLSYPPAPPVTQLALLKLPHLPSR